MYGVHVRRIFMGVTSYCFGLALFFVGVMADRLAMLAAVCIIIIRRRRDVVKLEWGGSGRAIGWRGNWRRAWRNLS